MVKTKETLKQQAERMDDHFASVLADIHGELLGLRAFIENDASKKNVLKFLEVNLIKKFEKVKRSKKIHNTLNIKK